MTYALPILLGLCAFAYAMGKLLKRKREEMEAAWQREEVEGELMRVYAYKVAGLREVPEPKR